MEKKNCSSNSYRNVVESTERNKNCTSSPTFAPLSLKATTTNSITMKLLGLSLLPHMFRKVLLHDILLTSSLFLFSSIPYLLISYLLDNHIFITLLRCFFVHSISNLILHCLLDNDSSSSTRLSFLLVVFK